jgi:D-beta-D-heptose 7-phosphate kinase/D-beta-D-heptose 1-phosphate adenosyltransferase
VRDKIKKLGEIKSIVAKAKTAGNTIVLTNGCFDLFHLGHLHLLREARKLGDLLVVAVNSDSSVKAIKGPSRPILDESERTDLLSALEMVDYVTVFQELDPHNTIRELQPNVLAKGGDWTRDQIIGREIVEGNGGKVVLIPHLAGYSTTTLIERIRRA